MSRHEARFVEKPWGREEIFAETEKYVGKILYIRKGEALSLQYHERKTETLRLLDGTLEISTGLKIDELATHRMKAGDVIHIEPGLLHRMIGVTDCSILEVSTPELDDVVRLEDRYGREGTTEA